MLTARLVVGSVDTSAFVPFELKDIPKTFPGRRWDKERKCWVIPVAFVNPLADALRVAGCVVYVTQTDGTPWTSGKAAHGTGSTPAEGWADQLFNAVGPERADAVYKALSRALHPDVGGGDVVLMQQLNAARERAAFSRRSAS